jgi:hypothetical protein
MRLKKVLVQNYRSIVDSTPVGIDDGVTVVIGKNEQRKSTFLNAIKAFNQTEHFTPGDLPNHLRPALDDQTHTNACWLPLYGAPGSKTSDFRGVIRGPALLGEADGLCMVDIRRLAARVPTATCQRATSVAPDGGGKGRCDLGIWLPGMDSNHDKKTCFRLCKLLIKKVTDLMNLLKIRRLVHHSYTRKELARCFFCQNEPDEQPAEGQASCQQTPAF